MGNGADGGYGTSRTLNISNILPNYQSLTVANFFRVISQYRTKSSGDVNYAATSFTYDSSNGILTFKGASYNYVSVASIYYVNELPTS